jgi:hypothetical protein
MENGRFDVAGVSLAAAISVIVLWVKLAQVIAVCLYWVARAWCACRNVFEKGPIEMDNSQKYGIKETTEVIDFGLALFSAVVESLKNDGKITFADLPNFGPAVLAVPAAIGDVQLVPAELGELSETEIEQIAAHVLARFPTVGEKWRVIAEESLALGLQAYRSISRVTAVLAAPKA